MQCERRFKHSYAGAAVWLALAAMAGAANAQAVQAPPLGLELNKLEPAENGCRMLMVVDNRNGSALSVIKLDLVFFQPDGVIGKRIVLDLAPVRAAKRGVKAFDIDRLKCDGIGSILINDVLDCRAETGPAADCLSRLRTTSLSGVELSK
jgi:hypothetical protein